MAVDNIFKPKKSVEISAGTQVGLFAGLIHLGTQKSDYKGEVTYKDQLLFQFELPDVLLGDGRPYVISKRETHSTGSKSNLLKIMKALNQGKSVDEGISWESKLGKPIMLNLKENSKGTGMSIEGYMAAPSGLTVKPLMGEPKLLLDVDKISEKELASLPSWIATLINARIKQDNVVDDDVDF